MVQFSQFASTTYELGCKRVLDQRSNEVRKNVIQNEHNFQNHSSNITALKANFESWRFSFLKDKEKKLKDTDGEKM